MTKLKKIKKKYMCMKYLYITVLNLTASTSNLTLYLENQSPIGRAWSFTTGITIRNNWRSRMIFCSFGTIKVLEDFKSKSPNTSLLLYSNIRNVLLTLLGRPYYSKKKKLLLGREYDIMIEIKL